MNKLIHIINKKTAVLLALFVLLGIAGCSSGIPVTENITEDNTEDTEMTNEQTTEEVIDGGDYICGGTTDNSDVNAPKVIESKDIVKFSADVYLVGEWSPGMEEGKYYFRVEEDDNGVLTAYENTLGLSHKADDELLTALQEMVDEQELAKMNGKNIVTAGLPPEYQEIYVDIDYASGENISFVINNDPEYEWEQKLYMTFADWFESQGDSSLVPPRATGKVSKLSIYYYENSLHYDIGDLNVSEEDSINGETYILNKSVFDGTKKETVYDKDIAFPEDYFDKITEIISKYDLRPFDNRSVLYGEGRNSLNEDSFGSSTLQIFIDYEDGYSIHISVSDKEDIDMLKPLVDELMTYHDYIFEGGSEISSTGDAESTTEE